MTIEIVPNDQSQALVDQVRAAIWNKRSLRIQGGNTKRHIGRDVDGEILSTRMHSGIVSYDPSELVITARSGTLVSHLIDTLEEHDQMLPFEPPTFSGRATAGGMVASGLSGPRRPWSGSVRDFVLGTRVITGEGKLMRFGGEVMKNVAGYDLSRLMAGSFGCLGVITEVSFKVLPKPRKTLTLRLDLRANEALDNIRRWRLQGEPLSAACHTGTHLLLRLEGGEGSVEAAKRTIGGDVTTSAFWSDLREFELPFFRDERPLWRLSVPMDTPLLDLPGDVLLDWGGAQRWLKSDAKSVDIRQAAHEAGGFAHCYTSSPEVEPFHPLSEGLMRYHHSLKSQLDPHHILNPGRLYAGL